MVDHFVLVLLDASMQGGLLVYPFRPADAPPSVCKNRRTDGGELLFGHCANSPISVGHSNERPEGGGKGEFNLLLALSLLDAYKKNTASN